MHFLLLAPSLILKQWIAVTIGGLIFVYAVLGDIAGAALIAGIFTLANTWLNARLHVKLNQVQDTNHEAAENLKTLVVEERAEREAKERKK